MMVRVKKANAEYRVPDENLNEFLQMGYCQIDEKGNIMKNPIDNSKEALKARIAALEKENESLKKQAEDSQKKKG